MGENHCFDKGPRLMQFKSETGDVVSLAGAAEGAFSSLSSVEKVACTDVLLSSLFKSLQPGGKAVLDVEAFDDTPFLLAGFVDVKHEGGRVEASKPEWEGQAQTLGGGVWKLDDDDLVDEDELIKDISTVNGPVDLSGLAPAGCGPAKAACDNCVCGRAEQEANQTSESRQQSFEASGAAVKLADGRVEVDTLKLKQAAGGCGSCSLGDAFRCAGCPSRGLPAYSNGEKIVLDL